MLKASLQEETTASFDVIEPIPYHLDFHPPMAR